MCFYVAIQHSWNRKSKSALNPIIFVQVHMQLINLLRCYNFNHKLILINICVQRTICMVSLILGVCNIRNVIDYSYCMVYKMQLIWFIIVKLLKIKIQK